MRYFAALAAAACLVESVAPTAWIPSSARSQRRNHNSPAAKGFVTTQDGQFMQDGKQFNYFGVNAYWLQHLSDADINSTMRSIAAKNITVVRTWAFNDVVDIPNAGAWFQSFNPNGTVTINNGSNGLQRLDRIFEMAKENGLHVQLALTSNWGIERETVANGTLVKRANSNITYPLGYLSNDYGGIAAYVRAHKQPFHDQFYSNETIIKAFEDYLTVVVPRYINHTQLVAWELANDARCNSTLPASSNCTTNVVTQWHSQIGQVVKRLDPNHIITSGTAGYFCADCPKLFPLVMPPQPSPSPGQKKRATGPLTVKRLLARRRANAKRNSDALKERHTSAAEKHQQGKKSKWMYRGSEARALTKRQSGTVQNTIGPAFDGSQGVDSEDIINIPEIDFSTFQLFPDQTNYEIPDPNLNATENTLSAGLAWIEEHATSAAVFKKPVALTGFGLVTQDNLPSFVPFANSQPLFPAPSPPNSNPQLPQPTTVGVGIEQNQLPVTNEEQLSIYAQWIEAAVSNSVSGIISYQWGQGNLTTPPPPPPATQQQITDEFFPTLPGPAQQNQLPITPPNQSPNDGYQIISSDVQNVLQAGAKQQLIRND